MLQSVFDTKSSDIEIVEILSIGYNLSLEDKHFAPVVMQIQDEVIVSDAERLRITQSNVKMVLLFPLLGQEQC